MTATTNTVAVRTDEETVEEYSGVFFAQHGTDDGVEGVVLEYATEIVEYNESIESRVKFVPGGTIVGVWDELKYEDEIPSDEFASYSQDTGDFNGT